MASNSRGSFTSVGQSPHKSGADSQGCMLTDIRQLYKTVVLEEAAHQVPVNCPFRCQSDLTVFSCEQQSFCPTAEAVKCSPAQAMGPSLISQSVP